LLQQLEKAESQDNLPKEYLLDASALIYIIASKKYTALEGSNCSILDLTYYEYGNSIINIMSKRGRQPLEEEINHLVRTFEKTVEMAPVVNFDAKCMKAAIDFAKKEKLTFYDSSYLYCCQHFNLNLITEDSTLQEAAKNNSINVTDTDTWIKSLRRSS
jgi:predicted nucleic acid-binding protein